MNKKKLKGPVLYLIVGDETISPCDHHTFASFKLWLARNSEASGQIDIYARDNIEITHWDDGIGSQFPYLLNPCECGTFLPMEVCENPMVSSSIGLLSDLVKIKNDVDVPSEFKELLEAMMVMAEKSIDLNLALEIR